MTVHTETAVWCATSNAYADVDTICPMPDLHVHYDVEYDPETGRVLTDADEQRRRRIAASPDGRLWQEVTYDLLHANRGGIHTSAKFIREHPAMVELLRRERERGTRPLAVGRTRPSTYHD